MIWHSGFENVRANFAAQFIPVGEDKYLYRLRGKGAPIRVSAEERKRFIVAFDRFLRLAWWALLGGTIAFLLALLVVQARMGFSDETYNRVFWIYGGVMVVGFLALYWRVSAAPSIELRNRPPEGGELTPGEFRQVSLKRMSFSGLILPVLFISALLAYSIINGEMLKEENRTYLVITVVSIGIVLFIIYRKWRIERSERQ
ncbi:MAG TPA: hypothetical protein VHL34_06120 [Rhizomicrobium sp.]|jgi:MFS family permease|nr:hypothetical protein [Rhizomicrobium sp.]